MDVQIITRRLLIILLFNTRHRLQQSAAREALVGGQPQSMATSELAFDRLCSYDFCWLQ
jgi:hypothetical protein